MTVVDTTGRAYSVGDYVFYTTNDSTHCVNTNVGKVVRVSDNTITLVSYRTNTQGEALFPKSVLQKPGRNIIIPEEIALIKSPKLAEYATPEQKPLFDKLGKQYELGHYVFCAQNYSAASVRTFFGKVVKINPKSIKVAKRGWRNNYYAATLLVPGRHLIIPEELALQGDPALKDVKLE